MFLNIRKMFLPQAWLGIRLKHTIYALSSGFGKCGVAVVRVSGPEARVALERMCKRLPPPRYAELKKIRDPDTQDILDHGLVLWFPGPASFTGEDCCELHVHGGSAVLSSIFTALSKLKNFRPAEPGEFTRRAFHSGKFDLTSVEGLADLINAETEYQRKQAVIQMNGALCAIYSEWRTVLSKVPCISFNFGGLLINIEKPREHERQFVDRHGKHSLNCMVVCGPNWEFYFTNASWPGSAHDSWVVRNSNLFGRMEEGWRPIPKAIILGDSGYPLLSWLLTPIGRNHSITAATLCLANVEAYIDFEEDQDIESSILNSIKTEIKELHTVIEKHLADGSRGERLRSGVSLTIAGAPNVGKSSLLNLLSKKPTAIVSDIPGTTRDIVKTDLDIDGYPVNVRDTAGLRKDTSDVVELEGINRAKAAIDETDLILVVLDAQTVANRGNLQEALTCISSYIESLGVPALDDVMLRGSHTSGSTRKCMVIVNKMDLVQDKTLMQALKIELGDGLCLLSCKTNEGTDEMIRSLSLILEELCGNPSSENPCFTQPRHRFCLEETRDSLARFSSFTDAEVDLAAQEVRNGLHSLGKITGHVSVEDILDIIFKEFCIGK